MQQHNRQGHNHTAQRATQQSISGEMPGVMRLLRELGESALFTSYKSQR